MVNHLKPEMIEVDVKLNDWIIDALIRSGRLQWHQKADDLAIRQAVNKLLNDLVHGRSM